MSAKTKQTIPGAPASYTTSFTYDAMDRVRTMTYPDGEVVTSAYNHQGLPQSLSGANSYVSGTDYNAASQLESLTFGNSAVTDYTYNPQNLRLTDIVTTMSGNTLLNLHYTFDNVGNILSVQDNARGETTNYSYDDLNRLMSASVTTGGNQYSRSWTYNTIGNTQTRVEQGVTTAYQYNDTTSKHAVTHLNNVLKYQYDANGNMNNRDGDTLTYDVENHLTSVAKAGVTTSFVYNGDGTRVKRSISNGGTTYYIGNYFEVYVNGATTFNKYYYFGSQRVAAKIASTLFYLQGDHLGSSSVAMTQSGTSFHSRQTYFPYGAQRTTEGSALPTDYTFTGQKNDDSTGLMFYGARYYDATLGRFAQPDTIVPGAFNPQAFNRYAYALNNPVRYTDPTGHMVDEGTDGGGGGGTDEPAEEEETEEETACAANDTDCDGVADDEETDTPADTGEEQGPDDKPGKCDVASADGGFGSDCDKKEQQEVNSIENARYNFMGISFSYLLTTEIWDPETGPFVDEFYFGGYDLIWVPDTGEFGIFHFGYATESHYQEGHATPQASLSLTGLLGQGLQQLSDYAGRAESGMIGLGPVALADTISKTDSQIRAYEAGITAGVPPLTGSLITSDWDMIWYWDGQ